MNYRLTGLIKKTFRGLAVFTVLTAAIALGWPAIGTCSDKNVNADLEALIQLLREKKVITPQEADTYLQRLYAAPAESTDALETELKRTQEELDRGVDQLMQKDRLTERRLEELNAKVKDEVMVKQYKSSWAERIAVNGDVRLRYQTDATDEGNEARLGGSRLEPTNIDRERARYRVRLGIRAKLIDPREKNVGKVDVGMRLATGNETSPVSTNDTIGDMFNKDSLVFDRAYLRYRWTTMEEIWGGKIPQITLIGGRMPNPFFSTDLVWDQDLNFEGLALKLENDTFSGKSWSTYLTAGIFPLDEFEYQTEGKWLYGAQLGLEHKPFWGLNYQLAVAYYAYDNIQGQLIQPSEVTDLDFDWTGINTDVVQGSNTLFDANRLNDQTVGGSRVYPAVTALASDFQELNVTLKIDIDRFYPVHVILWGDYVVNLGNDKDEMLELDPTIDNYQLEQDTGYQAGLTVGYPKPRSAGEWNLSFAYKYLESDAVLDAFTDSDFHLGGTDAQGFIAGAELGLYENVWLKLRYISTNEIIEEQGAWAVDTLQVDINGKF